MKALPTVNFKGIDADFMRKVERLDVVHHDVFGQQLTITSANDGTHSKGSKHYRGLAVDMRSWDKDDAQQVLWGTILAYLAPRWNLAVFDERARDKGPHYHIEVAD